MGEHRQSFAERKNQPQMFHAICHRIGDGLKGAKLQRSVAAEVGQLRMQRQQKNWGGASVPLVKFCLF